MALFVCGGCMSVEWKEMEHSISEPPSFMVNLVETMMGIHNIHDDNVNVDNCNELIMTTMKNRLKNND